MKINGKNLRIVKGSDIISGIISGLDIEALKLLIEENSAADDKPHPTPKDKEILAAIDAAILEFRTSGEVMKVVNND